VSVYFFLLMFAAYTLANWREVLVWFKRPLGKSRVARYALGLVLPVLFLVVVLPSYSPFAALVGTENSWASLDGIQKWSLQQKAEEGDRLRLAGKYQEALAAYAQADQNVPFTQIGIGLTEAELGKYDEAIGRIGKTSQDIAQSHLALGYIYLLQGNRLYARSEFNSRQVSLDELADNWAWDKLQTLPLLNNELNLGEFDWGYTSGFQIHEKDAQTGKFYRWTAGRGDDGQGRAKLRFPGAGAGNFKEVTLRLRGYRPENLNPPLVEVYANGQLLGKIQTTRDWADYSLKLPANLTGDIIIELGAPTFVPGATSRRELGVMVESAKLK
jgi:tetratricopeptide (TPR) repeat protein